MTRHHRSPAERDSEAASRAPPAESEDDAGQSQAVRVTAAVAEATGSELEDMEPLSAAIDPDSLDRIFGDERGESQSSTAHVTFEYEDCVVTVYADGQVVALPVDRP